MALFDRNGGLGNLFEGLTPFGTSIPSGILDPMQEEKLKNQALVSGLLGAGATYLATPKNLGAGSPLPYLGKAFLGGMGTSQDTINSALNNAYRQQLLSALHLVFLKSKVFLGTAKQLEMKFAQI